MASSWLPSRTGNAVVVLRSHSSPCGYAERHPHPPGKAPVGSTLGCPAKNGLQTGLLFENGVSRQLAFALGFGKLELILPQKGWFPWCSCVAPAQRFQAIATASLLKEAVAAGLHVGRSEFCLANGINGSPLRLCLGIAYFGFVLFVVRNFSDSGTPDGWVPLNKVRRRSSI